MPGVAEVNKITSNTSEKCRYLGEGLKPELSGAMMISEQDEELLDTQLGIQTEINSIETLRLNGNIERESNYAGEEMEVETCGPINEVSTGGNGEKEYPPEEIAIVNLEEHETCINKSIEDITPIVNVSVVCALESTKSELVEEAFNQLMDQTIPTSERDLVSVDNVHIIQRGECMITGKLERGNLKVEQEIEELAYKTNEFLEKANAGDHMEMDLLARSLKQSDVKRDMCGV